MLGKRRDRALRLPHSTTALTLILLQEWQGARTVEDIAGVVLTTRSIPSYVYIAQEHIAQGGRTRLL